MRRPSLIFAMVVMAALFVAAQTQTSGGDAGDNTSGPTEAVVTPVSPTGPTTPIITFETTSPSPAGATNATPGNQAGATNSTLQPTVTGDIASQTVFTAPVIENMPGQAGSSGNYQQTDRRDLLIGSSDSAWAISMETMGVAEAARQARALRASHKPRVFTNSDIARLRDGGAVSVVGNTPAPVTPVTNDQTMPASDVDADGGPTTPTVPQQDVQAPPTNQNPPAGQPQSPFRGKPSPQVQPR